MRSRVSHRSRGWRLLGSLAYGVLIALVVLLVLCGFRVGQAQGAPSIRLEWDYVQGPSPATGFLVEKCSGSATCTTFTSVTPTPLPITTLTYTDTAVQAGQTYRWRVLATGPSGVSAPSQAVSMFLPLPLPLSPTNVRATVVQ